MPVVLPDVVAWDRVVAAVRRNEANLMRLNSERNRRPRVASAGATTSDLRLARITGSNGEPSIARRYNVRTKDETVEVLNGLPQDRPFGTGANIDPAADDTYCTVFRDFDSGDWFIARCFDENVRTTACETSAGAGVLNSGVTTVSERSRGQYKETVITLAPDWELAVAAAASDRYGLKIYTFPQGAILVNSAVLDLVVAAPSITEGVRFALSTTIATGSGSDFTAAQEDTVLGDLVSGALTVGGTDYHRLAPDGAYADAANMESVLDSTSSNGSPLDLYLNLADSTAPWDASETITISGTITLGWRNGGDL